MLLKLLTIFSTFIPVFGAMMIDGTQLWLRQNQPLFKNMMMTKDEILRLEHNPDAVATAKLRTFKVFWTRSAAPAPTVCSWQRQWWDSLTRTKRTTCSSCCTTDLNAILPIHVTYQGINYDVYHPSDGYQILFTGTCSFGTGCSYGTCSTETDYYTWILISDPKLNVVPQLRFVPISYPRFCKCANVST